MNPPFPEDFWERYLITPENSGFMREILEEMLEGKPLELPKFNSNCSSWSSLIQVDSTDSSQKVEDTPVPESVALQEVAAYL